MSLIRYIKKYRVTRNRSTGPKVREQAYEETGGQCSNSNEILCRFNGQEDILEIISTSSPKEFFPSIKTFWSSIFL